MINYQLLIINGEFFELTKIKALQAALGERKTHH